MENAAGLEAAARKLTGEAKGGSARAEFERVLKELRRDYETSSSS